MFRCSLDKKEIIYWYYTKKLSLNQVSKKIGVSRSTITIYMDKYNLKRRRGTNIPHPWMKEKNHHYWKGDNVGYNALHNWVRRNKPKPKFCEECHIKPPYDVANISGKYLRDVNDFKWVCRGCHMKGDGRLIRLKKSKVKIEKDKKTGRFIGKLK